MSPSPVNRAITAGPVTDLVNLGTGQLAEVIASYYMLKTSASPT